MACNLVFLARKNIPNNTVEKKTFILYKLTSVQNKTGKSTGLRTTYRYQ